MIDGEGKGKENELRYSVSIVCLSAFWVAQACFAIATRMPYLGQPVATAQASNYWLYHLSLVAFCSHASRARYVSFVPAMCIDAVSAGK